MIKHDDILSWRDPRKCYEQRHVSNSGGNKDRRPGKAAASLRRFQAFHQSIRLLMELEGTPMGIVPDPRIFLEGAGRLGLKPEEIRSIGDNMEPRHYSFCKARNEGHAHRGSLEVLQFGLKEACQIGSTERIRLIIDQMHALSDAAKESACCSIHQGLIPSWIDLARNADRV
jgi:hypothetical protein